MPKLLTAVALATLVSTAIPAAAEDYKVTTCPKNLPYCTQVTKPILNEQEAARIAEQGSVVSYNPSEEAKKTATLHNDPSAVALCPPPYLMTDKDGCR